MCHKGPFMALFYSLCVLIMLFFPVQFAISITMQMTQFSTTLQPLFIHLLRTYSLPSFQRVRVFIISTVPFELVPNSIKPKCMLFTRSRKNDSLLFILSLQHELSEIIKYYKYLVPGWIPSFYFTPICIDSL